MDLLHYRNALSGTGLAIGFTLLVAWMVPPTDPKPAAPGWRANIRPVAPPAPPAFAGLPQYMATMPATPVEQYADASGDGAAAGVTVYRGSTADDYATHVSYAPAEQVDPVNGPVSGYGHRWTEDTSADAARRPVDEPYAAADDDAPEITPDQDIL